MPLITIQKALNVWGPGRKCVLCRALWSLLPTSNPVEVPQEVADKAVEAGAATIVGSEE